MTFQDMIDSATRWLEETVGSPVHWTTTEIGAAVNDGLEELSDGTEFFERNMTLTTRPQAIYYDLRTLCPTDTTILRVTDIWNPTRNQWLDPITVPDLDYRTARQWELVIGDPRFWFMRGTYWLGLFPVTTNDPGNQLKILYRALHPRLTDPTQIPLDLPEEYHRAIPEYATYDLLSKDGESQKAIQYWERYFEKEQRLAERVFGGIQRDRVPRMGIF